MENVEEYLINWVCEYIKENYNKFTKDQLDFLKNNKYGSSLEEMITEVKKDLYSATYIIFEFLYWNYKEEYKKINMYFIGCEDCDFHVIKLGDKYIKYSETYTPFSYQISFIEPKFKQIMYFE